MRLIDADALEKAISVSYSMTDDYGVQTGYAISMKLIEDMPTIEPEQQIVRCKDCKHRIEHKHYGNLGESAYTCEGNMDGWILPDDFCSYAERRTDESIHSK